MSFSVHSLLQEAAQLEQQFQAASNMMQQTAGALAYVRNKINELHKLEEELKGQTPKESDNGQVNDQDAG